MDDREYIGMDSNNSGNTPYSKICMAVGIVSLVTAFISDIPWWLSLAAGIVAIVLGRVCKQHDQVDSFRKAGVVCGWIIVVLSIVGFAFMILVLIFAGAAFGQILNMANDAVINCILLGM